jgi:hypothetical protein
LAAGRREVVASEGDTPRAEQLAISYWPMVEVVRQLPAAGDLGLDDMAVYIRAGDHALLIGRCEYHVDTRSGVVAVKDYSEPRSMRYQRYESGRPQPYMHPSIEDDRLPRKIV